MLWIHVASRLQEFSTALEYSAKPMNISAIKTSS